MITDYSKFGAKDKTDVGYSWAIPMYQHDAEIRFALLEAQLAKLEAKVDALERKNLEKK